MYDYDEGGAACMNGEPPSECRSTEWNAGYNHIMKEFRAEDAEREADRKREEALDNERWEAEREAEQKHHEEHKQRYIAADSAIKEER